MRLDVAGARVTISCPTRAMLFEQMEQRLRLGQGFALATINLDHLVKLRESGDFREAYSRHELVVADGNPVVWLSRLARRPVALLPGSELIEPICAWAARQGIAVAFCGSTAATLDKAATELRHKIPGLRIAAQIAPPMGFDPVGPDARAMLEELRAAGAGICFLALSAPKQEILAIHGRDVAPELGFVSIGAGLDFISGRQTRAPRLVRRLALEWLWRMLSDPKRLVLRYIKSALILPGQARAALRLRAEHARE
ncbi:MAG: WecB/TagA/CpsF family glycosyltransferase [Rhodobacteraceae bacterium]|nr:WecB/TagA/CpsF family glycosyltransferase [Paracoccaceae bacterium]